MSLTVSVTLCHSLSLTGVGAGLVLDAAEVPLHADADGVVLVAELGAVAEVEVVGLDLAGDAGVVLQAGRLGCRARTRQRAATVVRDRATDSEL